MQKLESFPKKEVNLNIFGGIKAEVSKKSLKFVCYIQTQHKNQQNWEVRREMGILASEKFLRFFDSYGKVLIFMQNIHPWN